MPTRRPFLPTDLTAEPSDLLIGEVPEVVDEKERGVVG